MKILIVNTSDILGGAARAAYRLHKSLLAEGVDSRMLVQNKASDDWTVIGPSSKLQKGIGQIRPALDNMLTKLCRNKAKTLFSTSWLPFGGIVDKINSIDPDIVHLHWICGGMMTIEDIAKIRAPVVWSLHDMWAFTDGYHYDEAYDIYKDSCQNGVKSFLSNRVFSRKQKTYARKRDITIVGLSSWLNECSKNSELLKGKQHVNLPNPIDTGVFKAFNKKEARKLWNLPHNKKLILFGAMSAASDPRKGFGELREALCKLKGNNNIELVVFGSSEPEESLNFGFKIHYLGSLLDDISLVSLYSAVDVVVVPSTQENLSNVIMESLSCSTPVVGFKIGGNSDMIDHKGNGYLARAFDTVDLKCGIEWVLNNPQYEEICINAKEKVLVKFDSSLVAKKYVNLYESTLSKSKF